MRTLFRMNYLSTDITVMGLARCTIAPSKLMHLLTIVEVDSNDTTFSVVSVVCYGDVSPSKTVLANTPMTRNLHSLTLLLDFHYLLDTYM